MQCAVHRRAGAGQDADHAERFVAMFGHAFLHAVRQRDAIAQLVAQACRHFRAQHHVEQADKGFALRQPQQLFVAIAEMLEISRRRAQHRKAPMRIAQRQRNRPRHGGVRRQRLSAVPADVVARFANPVHRIEQQLQRAGARPDDQIGAGHRLRETVARVLAHALDAEQQRHRQRDRDQRQAQRVAPVPGALQRERQQMAHTSPRRNNS